MGKLMLFIAFGVAATTSAHAQEQQLTPGHITEAAILGLDPHLFTRTELAQIDAETTLRDRRERIRYILEMKERRGEIPRGRFKVGPGGNTFTLGVGVGR